MEVEFNPYSKKTPINIVIKLLNSVEIPVFFVFFFETLLCFFLFATNLTSYFKDIKFCEKLILTAKSVNV